MWILLKTSVYQLYIFQLENYDLGRFWKLLLQKGLFPSKIQQRKMIVWTPKAMGLFAIGEILIAVSAGLIAQKVLGDVLENNAALVIAFLVLFFALQASFFLFLSLASCFLWPVDWIVKHFLTFRARNKIKSLSHLKVVGIAGSYGKTTMKNVLATVLAQKFKVATAPESINTPVGIARWILRSVHSSTELIIVEMGEHYPGDIRELCAIAQPDIAVVTGINQAHLERMKTMETLTATIFEIVGSAKVGASVMLNGDDGRVMGHYKEFVRTSQQIEKFQISNFKFQKFNIETLLWKVGRGEAEEFAINLLGKYSLGDADAAIKIGTMLGMSDLEIQKGISNIKPIEHRLQPIRSAKNVLVIDDSYNGNPQGVTEAIELLERFTNRRKIYITPGLVEMGDSTADIHRQMGEHLGQVVDVVILVKNSVTPYIFDAMKNAPRQPEIIWFDSALEAHAALGNILKPDDVILFQNDWGDQYI